MRRMLEHLPRELSPRRELARGSERRFFEIRCERWTDKRRTIASVPAKFREPQVPVITRTGSRRWALTLYGKREAVMKRILLAVSALAIADAAALTSANASQSAYAGDCRVIRERIETRRTGQPARLRITVKAAIPIRANADARRINRVAFRALAAEPVPRSSPTPVPSPPPASDAGQSESPKCQLPCE